MLPNFIGIGAYKSGTTWLFRCLMEHPEIFMAEVKETNFFDYETIDGRMSEYLVHFDKSENYKAVGEISNRYFTSKRAIKRIKNLIPEAKLFVSLRNPIDQVYSYYWHLHKQNFHEWKSKDLPENFEDALSKYSKRLLDNAYYSKHLNEWFKYFSKDQIMIIFYDDIVENPKSVINSIYSFLGVENSFLPKSLNIKDSSVRSGKSPRYQILESTRKSLYYLLSSKIYYPLKQLIGVKNAGIVKERTKIRTIFEKIFFKDGYPEMSPTTRQKLSDHFSEELSHLEELSGRDLSNWY